MFTSVIEHRQNREIDSTSNIGLLYGTDTDSAVGVTRRPGVLILLVYLHLLSEQLFNPRPCEECMCIWSPCEISDYICQTPGRVPQTTAWARRGRQSV